MDFTWIKPGLNPLIFSLLNTLVMLSTYLRNNKFKIKCIKDFIYMFMHFKENLFIASISMVETKHQLLNSVKTFMSLYKLILRILFLLTFKFITGQMIPAEKYFNTLFRWPTLLAKMNLSLEFAQVIYKNVLVLQSFWNPQRFKTQQLSQLEWNKLFLYLLVVKLYKK